MCVWQARASHDPHTRRYVFLYVMELFFYDNRLVNSGQQGSNTQYRVKNSRCGGNFLRSDPLLSFPRTRSAAFFLRGQSSKCFDRFLPSLSFSASEGRSVASQLRDLGGGDLVVFHILPSVRRKRVSESNFFPSHVVSFQLGSFVIGAA